LPKAPVDSDTSSEEEKPKQVVEEKPKGFLRDAFNFLGYNT